ncbi:MAG: GNAT family N-acetyltransferase [Bacteroidales bacterium]|nr:GNAT family N-acetyltransferase [Bacteroidales bacterium]
MMHYFEHKDIDKKKWDATIAECGNIYAFSWYLDIVHPGWEALVEDDYQSVMPLTGGKKFGVKYLFQPYFVQQLGVFSKSPLSDEKIGAFLQTIPQKYRFAEIRLNESNTLGNNFQGIGYHCNVILDLNRDYDKIKANYHTNTKRNLAKAENSNLQIVDTVIPYHVVALFTDNRGALLDKWGEAEYARLTKLTKMAVNRNAAFILGVTEKGVGQLLCAAIFMKANGRVTFLFSGLTEEGKRCQAMTYLLDHVIQEYANQPVTFDFEGSDDDNLARFYLGFGGQEVKYPSFAFNRLSPVGKAMLKIWKKRK